MDVKTFSIVQSYQEKEEVPTESQAIVKIIEEYDNAHIGLSKLYDNIDRKNKRIEELEYAMKNIYGKQMKELVKDE